MISIKREAKIYILASLFFIALNKNRLEISEHIKK